MCQDIKVNRRIQFIYQNENFENHMESFLKENESNSHQVYNKDLHRFTYNKTKHKGKKIFFA